MKHAINRIIMIVKQQSHPIVQNRTALVAKLQVLYCTIFDGAKY